MRFVAIVLSGAVLLATSFSLPAQGIGAADGAASEGAARPYPFGVFRLDALNSFGPDTRGWNILTPQDSYPGPAHLSPSRSRYGLPPLGSEDNQAFPAAPPQPGIVPDS